MTAALRGTETGLQYQQAVISLAGDGRATIELMAKAWSKLHSSVDLGMRKQVTRLGLLFTMSCLLVALAAFASANNLLFLILAAMIATLMVSEFISRLSLAGLELDF